MSKKILFIGGGNMARAILGGLVQHGYPSQNIYVVDRNADKREALAHDYKVQVSENVGDFVDKADTIIVAIKPQGAKELCESLEAAFNKRSPLIISLMAGVSLASLQAWLGQHLSIVRVMPNTPAVIQEGASAYFGNDKTSTVQYQEVETIFSAVGVVAKLENEMQMNAITALSGSGPAYYFYFMEAMQNAAEKLGIDKEIAKTFAIQTAYGAAKLAKSADTPLATLRAQVTSKKGTTQAALDVMQAEGLESLVEKALNAANARAIELSQS